MDWEEDLVDFKKLTKGGLEFTLTNHRNYDLDLLIHAPVILFPENCLNENSFLFVADLGTISVNSTLISKEDQATIMSNLDFSQSTNLNSDLIYDIHDVSLKDLQIFFYHSLSDYSVDPAKLTVDRHFLSQVDVLCKFKSCILDDHQFEFPAMKLEGHLPEIKVLFSDKKYDSLMKLIDMLFPSDSPSVYRITENDQVNQQSESASKFGENMNIISPREKELKRFQFEMFLTVGRVAAEVAQHDSASKHDLIISKLAVHNAEISIQKRPFDLDVGVNIQQFTVTDEITDKFLVTSNYGSTADRLLKVQVHMNSPDHPFYASKFHCIKYQVRIEMSSLQIYLNSKRFIPILTFVNQTFINRPSANPPHVQPSSSDFLQLPQSSLINSAKLPEYTNISFQMNALEFTLSADSMELALFTFLAAKVDLKLEERFSMSGKLGEFNIQDLTSDKFSNCKMFVSSPKTGLLDFLLTPSNPKEIQSAGQCHQFLWSKSGSPTIFYQSKFILSLISFYEDVMTAANVSNVSSQTALDSQPVQSDPNHRRSLDIIWKLIHQLLIWLLKCLAQTKSYFTWEILQSRMEFCQTLGSSSSMWMSIKLKCFLRFLQFTVK